MATRTTAIEDDVVDAIVSAIDGVTGIEAEEIYRYPRGQFHSELPSAYVVLDSSEQINRADDKCNWKVQVWLMLVSRVEQIAEYKAWVLNALEEDETLGGTINRLNVDRWEFGYPVFSGEGEYEWCETWITAQVFNVERGINIETA